MSDSSRVSMYVATEATFGVDTGLTVLQIPFTGESLKQTTENERSAEIRSDRNVVDIVRTGISGGGDINVEWKHDALPELMRATFMNAAPKAKNIFTQTGVTFTSGRTLAGSGADWANAEPGDWFQVIDAAESLNNGFFQVESSSTNFSCDIVFNNNAADGNFVADSGDTIKVCLFENHKNGNTPESVTIVKKFPDLHGGGVHQLNEYIGCRVGSFSFNIVPGAINSGSFSIVGLQEKSEQTSISGVTITDRSSSSQVTNSVDHIQGIRVASKSGMEGVTSLDVTELSLTAENNLRANPRIGSVTAGNVGLGRFTVSGSFKGYFSGEAELENYLDWDSTGLSFQIVDDAGNMSIFDMPAIRFTDAQVLAGGNDSDVMVELTFESYIDSDFEYTLQYSTADAADLA